MLQPPGKIHGRREKDLRHREKSQLMGKVFTATEKYVAATGKWVTTAGKKDFLVIGKGSRLPENKFTIAGERCHSHREICYSCREICCSCQEICCSCREICCSCRQIYFEEKGKCSAGKQRKMTPVRQAQSGHSPGTTLQILEKQQQTKGSNAKGKQIIIRYSRGNFIYLFMYSDSKRDLQFKGWQRQREVPALVTADTLGWQQSAK